MKYLAVPYNMISTPIYAADGTLYEVIAPGCFDLSRPVPLVRGHVRNRRDWIVGRVQCFSDERGVYFEFEGELPANFSGFSVRFKPLRWRRIGPQTIRLIEAKLRHIALLTKPDSPVYPSTFSQMKGSKYGHSC